MTWEVCATIILAAAWVGHTDDSRAYALDIVGALLDIGMSHKSASIDMGLTDEAELSKQLAGTKPLNAFRLSSLPRRFHVAFLRRQVDRYGAAMVAPEDLALIRGAAVLGPDRIYELLPARTRTITLPFGQEEMVA